MQAVSTLRFKTNLGDYGQPIIKPFLFDGTVFIITTGCGFFHSGSQMCMMGGTRPKWTRLVAIFSSISALNIECDGLHSHQPWGKTMDAAGNEFYATSLEAEHPRRFCIAVVQCVHRTLQRQHLELLPNTLFDIKGNKMFEMQTARITALNQSRRSKLPHLMPDSSSAGIFFVLQAADVSCALQAKLSKPLEVFTSTGNTATVPAQSLFCEGLQQHHLFQQRGVSRSVMLVLR